MTVTSPGARSTSSDSTSASYGQLETSYPSFTQSTGGVRSFDGLQNPIISRLQDPRNSWETGAPLQIAPNLSRPSSVYHSVHSMRPQGRKIPSQYPPDPSKSHVEFILVAAFDTDRGSVMEHQYPGPISGDEHMLAELMLPDQAHSRSQDWTIFFLHKDSGDASLSEGNPKVRRRNKIRSLRRLNNNQEQFSVTEEGDEYSNDSLYSEGDADEEGDHEEAMEGPPLIYVLNLVNTKKDSSAKRGATVKAMAVCTRHPFLHIYKPLLLLALEEYFRVPTTQTLASLYNAVNSMDLSLMPRLSPLERSILQASNAKDLFLDRFRRMIDQRRAEDGSTTIDNTPRSSADAATGTLRFLLPRDTHEFESRIIYNGISVPVKIPTARSPETVGDFSIIKLIQTFSEPHMAAPQPFAVHPHLTTSGAYTHPIIVLVNAILTQKRIMFLGYNRPSGDVAEAVLASCALASGGILRGFTRHAFPYTDLTKIDDLLKVPGFIAGVTNPVFANKPECWDLLCDLPAGRMKISSRIAQPVMTDGVAMFQQQNPSVMNVSWNPQLQLSQDSTGDVAFMDAVQRNISNRLGEVVMRMMWRDWIVRFTRIAAVFEEAIYGTSALYIGGPEADEGAHGVSGHGYVWTDEAARQRELAGNVHRIEGWRSTRSYYSLIQDLAQLYTAKPITSVDLHHHHDRLRTQKLQHDEAAAIYLAFSATAQSPAEICQLLTVTSESHGGLFHVALGLLHPRKEVRYRTVELLDRVTQHEAGQPFWESLGRFSKLAFYRLRREMESTARSANDSDAERGPPMEEASIEAAFRAAQRDGGGGDPHHGHFGAVPAGEGGGV